MKYLWSISTWHEVSHRHLNAMSQTVPRREAKNVATSKDSIDEWDAAVLTHHDVYADTVEESPTASLNPAEQLRHDVIGAVGEQYGAIHRR